MGEAMGPVPRHGSVSHRVGTMDQRMNMRKPVLVILNYSKIPEAVTCFSQALPHECQLSEHLAGNEAIVASVIEILV